MVAKEMWVIGNSNIADAESLFAKEAPLPLDNLDKNILCDDALFADWPKADAIVGNPPYLGSRYIAQEHGHDYARKLYARFPTVPKMADFCTHWFRLAHNALPEGGRAGLVGTNSIRQNEGREASLDHIIQNGGTITEAISTQVWSGDAAVHVSIVNWIKGDEDREKLLLIQKGDGVASPWEVHHVKTINSSLSPTFDVTSAQVLKANKFPKRCYQGQKPNHEGFFLTQTEAYQMLQSHPNHREVLFPYLVGSDLVEAYRSTKWVIDFGDRDVFGARAYPAAFERIKHLVMSDIVAKAAAEKATTGKNRGPWARMADRWWIHERHRPECIAAIHDIPRYIAVSRTTKRPIFDFVSSEIHPDTRIVALTLPDDYSFGIIQSSLHWSWLIARCTTLKADPNYNEDSVYCTFPWPQYPTRKQIQEVAKEAVALRQFRREVMVKMDWSLRDLYRTLEEPGSNPLRDAQAKLDAAVRTAYAMSKDADILPFLLALNQTCAAREAAGEAITAPGLPLPLEEHAAFITEDCIKVSEHDGSTTDSFAAAAHLHVVVNEGSAQYGSSCPPV